MLENVEGREVCKGIKIGDVDYTLDENGEYFLYDNKLLFAKLGEPICEISCDGLAPEKNNLISSANEAGEFSPAEEKEIREVFLQKLFKPRKVTDTLNQPKIIMQKVKLQDGSTVEVCAQVKIGRNPPRDIDSNGEYFVYGNNILFAKPGQEWAKIKIEKKDGVLIKGIAQDGRSAYTLEQEQRVNDLFKAKLKKEKEQALKEFTAYLPKEYRAPFTNLQEGLAKISELRAEDVNTWAPRRLYNRLMAEKIFDPKDDLGKFMAYMLNIECLEADLRVVAQRFESKQQDYTSCYGADSIKDEQIILDTSKKWILDGDLTVLEKYKNTLKQQKQELEAIQKKLNERNNRASEVFDIPADKEAKGNIFGKIQALFPKPNPLTRFTIWVSSIFGGKRNTVYNQFRKAVLGIESKISDTVEMEETMRKKVADNIHALGQEIKVTDKKIETVQSVKEQIVAKKAEVKAKARSFIDQVDEQERKISNQERIKEELTQAQQEQQAKITKITADVAAFKARRDALSLFYGVGSSEMNKPALIGAQDVIAVDAISLGETNSLIQREKKILGSMDEDTNPNFTPGHIVRGGLTRLNDLEEMSRSLDPNGGHSETSTYIEGELNKTKAALEDVKTALDSRLDNIETYKKQSLAYAKDTIAMAMGSVETQLAGYDEALKAAVKESGSNPFFHEQGLLYKAIQQRGELANYLNDSSLVGHLDAKGEVMRQKLLELQGLSAEDYSEKLNEIKNGNLEQLRNGFSEALGQFNKLRSLLRSLEGALTSQNYAEKIEEIWGVIAELQELSRKIDGLKLEVEAATRLAQDNSKTADEIIEQVATLAKQAEERTAAARREVEKSEASRMESKAEVTAAESKPALIQRPLHRMELVADIHVGEARTYIQEKTGFINTALKEMSESSLELKECIELLETARQAGDIERIRVIHTEAKYLSEQNHDDYAFIQAAILVRQACEVLLLKGQIEQLNNSYAVADGPRQVQILAELEFKKQKIMNGLDELKQALALLKLEAEQSEFNIAKATGLRRAGKQAGLLVEVNGKRLYDEGFLMLLNELENVDIIYAVEEAVKGNSEKQTQTVQSELRAMSRVLDNVLRFSDLKPTDVQYIEIEVHLSLNRTELATLLFAVKKEYEDISSGFFNDKPKVKALAEHIEAEVAKADDPKEFDRRLDSEFFDALIQKIKETGGENAQPYSDWIVRVSAMKGRYEEAKKEYFKKEMMAVLQSEPEESEKVDDRLINLGSRFFGDLVAAMDNKLAAFSARNGQESSAFNDLKRRAIKIGAKVATEENKVRNEQRIAVEAKQAALAEANKKEAESLIMDRIELAANKEFSLRNLEQSPAAVLKEISDKVSLAIFDRVIKGLENLKDCNSNPEHNEHYDIWLKAAKEVVVAKNIEHRSLASKSNNPFAPAPESAQKKSGLFGFFAQPKQEEPKPVPGNGFKRTVLSVKAAVGVFLANAATWVTALFESGGTGVL